MKYKLSIFVLVFISFLCKSVYAEFNCEAINQTALVQLPNQTEMNWKKFFFNESENFWIVEYIPISQDDQNFSDLVVIQYNQFDPTTLSVDSYEQNCEFMCQQLVSTYPEFNIGIKTLDKYEDGMIQELIIINCFEENIVEHTISRIFLTPSGGVHRVAFTKKNAPISAKETQKWLHILKENTSIVSFEEAKKKSGLSRFERRT